MKPFVIIIVLIGLCSDIFANLTQGVWRWRNDNGSETSATWKAAQNTVITLNSTGEIVRLRIEILNNSASSFGISDSLQWATSTSGPWASLEITAGSNPFMIANVSAFVVQAEATTAQLTGQALSFLPGKIMVDSARLTNFNMTNTSRTEFEWAIRGTSNTVPNTTYYFRESGTTNAYSVYPSLNTALVLLPIKLTAFTVNRADKKVRIEWVTASEQNNDRFEIRRSGDGSTWKTIATVKGHGTSSATNTYETYDPTPLSGVSYYAIKQWDVDGHSYLSDVRSVRMPGSESVISVYPNPAHSSINFSTANKAASNIEAILIDANGKTILREMFTGVPVNAINKLTPEHQLDAGVYVLKIKSEGLTESVKIIVE